MHIVALSTLRTFWKSHPDAETPLWSWYARASGKAPTDIKAAYGNASFAGNNRVEFNTEGNDYRLVVVRHGKGLIYVRFGGTHRQYDKIGVETICRNLAWSSS